MTSTVEKRRGHGSEYFINLDGPGRIGQNGWYLMKNLGGIRSLPLILSSHPQRLTPVRVL